MTFVHPYLMIIVFVPFILFSFLVLTNKEKVSRVFDTQVLQRLRVDGDVLPVRIRNIILLTSILLMVMALGRPVIEQGERTVSLKGLDAMMALDISGSMRSRDVYPDRLTFAKRKMSQLLEAMPNDTVSLAAFAHAAFMLAPFTTDKAALQQILNGVDESYINLASTDFGALADLASTFLEKKKPKILIVFTDGGDVQALKSFEPTLKQAGITLYAVLVGTRKGAPVLNSNGQPIQTAKGNIAITQRNDALGKIAKDTGGMMVLAHNGKSDMVELSRTIHKKFAATTNGNIKVKERIELFVYFLAASVLLLILGLMSLPRNPIKSRRSRS